MKNTAPTDAEKAAYTQYVAGLINHFTSTPTGHALMKDAEDIAVKLVALEESAGIPFGPLAPFVAGLVIKGMVYGMDKLAHSGLTHEQWSAMGGCDLALALAEGTQKQPIKIDHTSN